MFLAFLLTIVNDILVNKLKTINFDLRLKCFLLVFVLLKGMVFEHFKSNSLILEQKEQDLWMIIFPQE
jgi:hypothetical protein